MTTTRADATNLEMRDPISWHMVGAVPTIIYYPVVWAAHAGRILWMAGQTASGTATVRVFINGNPVTGLQDVTFDSTGRVKHNATAAYDYAEGDEITMQVVSGTVNGFRWAIGRAAPTQA